MFSEQAARTPHAVALVFQGIETTYDDLDRRSNRFARHLRDLGADRGQLVGLHLERSPTLIVALLGILKSGAAYVPLDPAYPHLRLNYMIEDSGVSILVSRPDLARQLSFAGAICDAGDDARFEDLSDGAVDGGGDGKDLAYVIYTSGSTGHPKGVMLSHTATALVRWAQQAYSSEELARVAATTSVCFDPSIFEIFAPLCSGGTIILKENALESFSPDEQPTLLTSVPSVLEELVRMGSIPASVKTINAGGEKLTRGLADRLYQACSIERLLNHYGPTEATTCTTVSSVPRGGTDEPTIGSPICEASIHILGEDGEPVVHGDQGEIYIAGPMLAMGYLHRPALTAERFLEHPNRVGVRLYRTGDIGKWTASGELHYIGRTDNQVKLRGFRIELSELEAALLGLPGVRQAAALVKSINGSDRLVAYLASDTMLDTPDVRRRLATSLPIHMLPSAVVLLPSLPQASSGKVDRNRLPDPEEPPIESPATQLPPIEDFIAETFRSALGNAIVGADDNFFELGGDSLLAIDVALRIEDILKIAVPPALLAHHPTPHSLAGALESLPSAPQDCLTALQPEGANPPIFCLPDLFGLPLSYMSLARRLAPDQPVYGLSPGPLDEDMAANPSMKRLVSAFVHEIRTLQPDGPYHVSGYSFGGTFAFAVASALEADGHAVKLILIDSSVHRRLPTMDFMLSWARREWADSVKAIGFRRTARRIVRYRHTWMRWFSNKKIVGKREVPYWVPRKYKPIARGLMQARIDYQIGSFGGPTLVLISSSQAPTDSFLNSDGLLGWREFLTGPVVRQQIDETHYRMMQEPFVGEIARLVRTFV